MREVFRKATRWVWLAPIFIAVPLAAQSAGDAQQSRNWNCPPEMICVPRAQGQPVLRDGQQPGTEDTSGVPQLTRRDSGDYSSESPTVITNVDGVRETSPTNASIRVLQPRIELRKPEPYTDFQKFAAASLGYMIPVYGRNLFENVPSTFAPVDRIPVTSDYMIGPGDEILIRGWGQVQINVRATVDRDGSIFIPKVGNISVAGVRYDQLQGYLKSQIGRVFQNFDLTATLGQLRSIQVFVVGQARRPGSYTVSSLSTVVNALFASGGPSPNGSMRHIQLKRNNKIVTEIDLYDLLLNGDKSKDVVLLSGDVIYIPPIGKQVAVAGAVNVPGIYELKDATTLGDAIAIAGGMTTTAEGDKVVVERIDDHTIRTIETFPLDSDGLKRLVKDGDVVNVRTLSPRFENSVTLRGNVAQPGRYPWKKGMRVSDLIPNREFLLTRQYWSHQNRITEDRVPAPNRDGSMYDDGSDYGDGSLYGDGSMYGNGSMYSGGSGYGDGSTYSGTSMAAGTSSYGASTSGETTRGSQVQQTRYFTPIQPAVRSGNFELRNDIKQNAPGINWDYAAIQRLDKADLSTRLLTFNLGKAILDHDDENNLLLQPGDIVTIFSQADMRVPISEQTKFVRLEGEVKRAGVYQVENRETLRDLVARAGGLTSNAYLFGAQFTRESTRQEQQKRMDAIYTEMEQDIDRTANSQAQKLSNPEDAAGLQQRIDGERQLLAKMRTTRAKGRVVLNVKPSDNAVDALPDIVLEDGDRLIIPSRPDVVNVMGSVYNENAYMYRRGAHVSDYLRMAGGAKRDADSGRIYVIRADGSIVGRKGTSSWWTGAGFNGLRLMPGDTIVVPERLQSPSVMRGLRDWTQVFSQMALGAAAIHVIGP